ncbi:hypothetical protein [Actinomadura decatromicini]|uniref:Uncharacterized protein n=1 Tax=Actinomadura decatromicini TaxID=2604572 RepID=A0A5D3FZW9_9ACTN|nr:hypothetical protein [Actinomadura decatromicini]TYK53506.1 hypothetical protein FXF68_07415 [Actinomadura decatromicini]
MANHCRVGVDDHLHIRWQAPVTDGDRVVLRKGASPGTRVETIRGDRRSVRLPLAGLAPGKWEVRVESRGTDRPLLTDDPGFSFDELRDYAAGARDRTVRVVRVADGAVRLVVREVTPHAEVEAVDPRDGEIRFEGRLAYAGPRPGADARLVAVARDTEVTLTWDARLDGIDYRTALLVDDLAAQEPALWDLWLDVGPADAPDVHARLASRLDDATGKRGKLSYPRQLVVSGERELAVRPYYTPWDNLSVACRPTGDGAQ